MEDSHENCVQVDITGPNGAVLPVVIHENGDVSLPVGDASGETMILTIPNMMFQQIAMSRTGLLLGGFNAPLTA